jgi:hypothetical protein
MRWALPPFPSKPTEARRTGPPRPMPAYTPEQQRIARESFDLEATLANLPPYSPENNTAPSHRGQAGVRLRAHLVADISDELLREVARETLGAHRCSEGYLDALRVVLGNQAEAERYGYVLEMNRRVSFAPEQVMRTIIDQMQAAGITFGKVVKLGRGRQQLVQCFHSKATQHHESPAHELAYLDRCVEAQADARRGDHPGPTPYQPRIKGHMQGRPSFTFHTIPKDRITQRASLPGHHQGIGTDPPLVDHG